MATPTVKLHVAWWFKPYLYMLSLMCTCTGREMNHERVQYWFEKAVTAKVCK